MTSIELNAWTGSGPVTGEVGDAVAWAVRQSIESAPRLLAPDKVDYLDWNDPRVGWGVILKEGAALPPALQELMTQRKAPVFRFMPDSKYRFVFLRNHAEGKDININAAPHGTAPDALPYYLLIYGLPDDVPWQLQYVLNANRCVGRLWLTGKELENYINAILRGVWAADEQDRSHNNRSLIWSVVSDKITALMRNSIAWPLATRLQKDSQIGKSRAKFVDGAQHALTNDELTHELTTHRPTLIVTTSHGMTSPLDNPELMKQNLGAPVDALGKVLDVNPLLREWQPAGAIWYAHACCSAGADNQSNFDGLFEVDSVAGTVLHGVAELGAQIAPLATALLGAEYPVRAFIGHVEPTFDWTLKENATGQFLTDGIVKALYNELYVGQGDRERPIGYAFREWYARTNGLCKQYDLAKKQFNNGEPVDQLLATLQLAARDVESTVILGDPTVAMPALQ